MKPAILGLLLVSALLFVPPSSVALDLSNCTRAGTEHDDALPGTRSADIVCGGGGKDYVHGGQGDDILVGGPGRDTLVGGAGMDKMLGGARGDRLFAVDHQRDVVVGGAGRDRCFADPVDRTRGCERTFRGVELRDVTALADIMYDTMIESEDGDQGEPFLAEAFAPPSQTDPGFPPCTPPPPGSASPAPCPGG